jgi:hypothetical protein
LQQHDALLDLSGHPYLKGWPPITPA